MKLKNRLDKLEPLIRERQIKQAAAALFQLEIAEGLLNLHKGLSATDYGGVEKVLLEHLHEVLQDAYGYSWRKHLWIESLSLTSADT